MTVQEKKQAATGRGTAQVPTINERRRISRQAVENAVRQIVQQFQPQQIILFGSYAYGQPRQESDVDLLVVMNTPATMARRLALGDPFLREVVSKGEVLYERTDG